MSGETINIPRDIWDDPSFPEEPLSEREAYIWLAAMGRIVRATVKDLARSWYRSNRRAAHIVKRFEARGLVSVSGQGAAREITVSDRYATPIGLFVCQIASFDPKTGSGLWRGEPLSRDVRQMIYERDRGICRYCKEPVTTFHVDHIVPVARGGTDRPKNLALSCVPCNLKKAARTPEEMGWDLQ